MNRSSSRSTSSTVVPASPAEHTPLLDSASDRTLRARAAESESEWDATAPMGMPLAHGLLGRVSAMYYRAVRSHDSRREDNEVDDVEVGGGGGDGDDGVTDVSRVRGFFICFSVWVLLFLQGEFFCFPLL